MTDGSWNEEDVFNQEPAWCFHEFTMYVSIMAFMCEERKIRVDLHRLSLRDERNFEVSSLRRKSQ